MAKIMFIIVVVLCVLLLLVFINHRIKLQKEKGLLVPLGQRVEVGGKKMCVYTEGEGENTIVFLAGGGIASPTLDFKSLYSQLTNEYRIAVVEKFGYGFSEEYDGSRDIDTMLEDTRTALSKAGLQAPYILAPHSMSGLEAIYWSQKYPEEVSAIVGLDMAVPEYYVDLKFSSGALKMNQVLCEMGLVRLISGTYINALYADSTLTEEDKRIVKALYSKRCISDTFINEAKYCRENARKIDAGGVPQVPVLMFISNGERINMDKELWKNTAKAYAEGLERGEYVQLDCPHQVHNVEYKKIAEEMKRFLKKSAHFE